MRKIILIFLSVLTGCETQSEFTVKQSLTDKRPSVEFTVSSNSFKVLK